MEGRYVAAVDERGLRERLEHHALGRKLAVDRHRQRLRSLQKGAVEDLTLEQRLAPDQQAGDQHQRNHGKHHQRDQVKLDRPVPAQNRTLSHFTLWKRLWLLFTVIWVTVAALNIFTILAFGEETPPEKALWPLFFAIAVPALVYALGWIWEKIKEKSGPEPGP